MNSQLYIPIIQAPKSSAYTTSLRTNYNQPTIQSYNYEHHLNLKNSINLQLQAYNQFILMQAHINQIIHTYQIHVHV